jgi:hypothetical protein
VLSRFVERLLWHRGALPAEKVTGGISESAFQLRKDISRGIPAQGFSPVRKGPGPKLGPEPGPQG